MASLINLPLGVRCQIFRDFALSVLSKPTNAAILPRPVVCDGQIIPAGYFPRGTVLPLLLTCRAIHDDVAAILYGENVFVFHISGLNTEEMWWLSDRKRHRALGLHIFSERYWPLVRRLWVWTGHGVPQNGLCDEASRMNQEDRIKVTELHRASIAAKLRQWKQISKGLMEWIQPHDQEGFIVNTEDHVGLHAGQSLEKWQNVALWMDWQQKDWPTSLNIVWKLMIIEEDGEVIRREFRRVVWPL